MKPDITAIVNLHLEGYLCAPTLQSVRRAARAAESAGIRVEVLLVADRVDMRTIHTARALTDDSWRIFEVTLGDLGAARNFGARKARGDLLAFVDGDDLWADDWLIASVRASRETTRRVVWHPQINLFFGGETYIFCNADMDDEGFDLIDMAFVNPWTALVSARREIFLDVPYPKTNLTDGIGYEDWGWNLKTIEHGIAHKIIPGTGHAIRRKRGTASLLERTNAMSVVPSPTLAFRRLLSDQ
ncbi:MAG: glycosyltransferase family 2 protein [Rhodobiaceae bacterium]|nr:glycosyltransferase family 2 protein [Rhodobiaceae bacterium]MCC0055204.1 glycosyltransferase family 2 protein [Rhodobiaceae bacterium]